MKIAWMRNLLLVITGTTLALTSGCAKFDIRKNIPWGEGANGRVDEPFRIVAVWTDTKLYKNGNVPQRGFGGRVMFYGENQNEPAKVEGSLVVYAFDETSRDPTNVKPDRKYVFSADQVEKQYSKTKLGHSYSFWLPWDEVGGPQRQISLICRFMPKKGGPVVSDQTKHILPGTETVADLAQEQPGATGVTPVGGVQQAGGAVLPGSNNAQQQYGVQQAVSWQPAAGQQNSYPVQQATFEQATGPGLTPPNAAGEKGRRMKSETIAVRAIGGTQARNTQRNSIPNGDAPNTAMANVAYPQVTQGVGFAPFTNMPQGYAGPTPMLVQPWMINAAAMPQAQPAAANNSFASANGAMFNGAGQAASAFQAPQSQTNSTAGSAQPTSAAATVSSFFTSATPGSRRANWAARTRA